MKHIIVGIDGTWRAAYGDELHSNVFRLNLALDYRDRAGQPQFFIYSGGLGTNGVSSHLTGGLLADGLDENILQAYINICSNYEPGDRIYLFGFSRGAIAVRALCGFITKCGLLQATQSWLIKLFWKVFTDRADESEKIHYANLKRDVTHSDVRIEFLGVWDTVSGPFRQLELFRRFRFQNLLLDRSVKNGIHVVSIDDTRRHFSPLLWAGRQPSQTIEQIWMPGVHSDIGGGYPNSFFANLSLILMLDKLRQCCPGLAFLEDYVDQHIIYVLNEQDIVINDEWGFKLSSFTSPRSRRFVENGDEFHTQHPITGLISNKQIRIRKKPNRYVPSFRLMHEERPLADTQFVPESWYETKVAGILHHKTRDLP
jgi:hypothetical protein